MLQRITKWALSVAAMCAVSLGVLGGSAFAAESYVVQYRLVEWKTAHFEEAAKADAHLVTLKNLGCEAQAGDHGGHIDVRYRCPAWRSLAVQTDAGAHRWEKWLRACGFETAHQH